MALPFTYSANDSNVPLPDLLRLPGPCTVTTVPAWGCPSNIFELRRIDSVEVEAFCKEVRVIDRPVVFSMLFQKHTYSFVRAESRSLRRGCTRGSETTALWDSV